jgi:hypothetical protein
MDIFSPWDIADSFRLHEAACLMAGVPLLSKRVPNREELPANSIPYYVKLAKAYFVGAYVFERPEDERFQREELLTGQSTHESGKPDIPNSIDELTGELVTRSELHRWIMATGIETAYSFAPREKSETSFAQNNATLGRMEPVEIGRDAPLPLCTSDIANCFRDLKWSETKWKANLGKKPKWLQHCVVIPGVQGVSEIRWSPVSVGAALVMTRGVTARSIRARFQANKLLSEWQEAWKDYEAQYLTTD